LHFVIKVVISIVRPTIPITFSFISIELDEFAYARLPSGDSIIPKKMFAVIGLESSGTTFVTRTLSKALGYEYFLEGSIPRAEYHNEVEVQHFSLPWGSHCVCDPEINIQNVVLPVACSSIRHVPFCMDMARDLKLTTKEGRVVYPNRYFLDIISNKEWYESKGVDITFIIVIREPTVSRNARFHSHCGNQTLLEIEEEIGTDIMIRAINKYILHDRKLSASTYGPWYNEMLWRETNNTTGRNTDTDPPHRELSSALLSGNNVVLVSYDSLVKMDRVYVKLLYKALGIESDYMPTIDDGNEKYIKKINYSNHS